MSPRIPSVPGYARTLRDRRYRWAPMAAIALGLAGFTLALAGQPGTGTMVLMAGIAAASWLPFVGPMRVGTGGAIADEFNRALYTRAYLATLGSIAFAAFLGILLLAGFTLLHGWTRETLLAGMVALAMLLPLLWSAVPTLYASWVVEPLDDEE
jgi:hypothetical protein